MYLVLGLRVKLAYSTLIAGLSGTGVIDYERRGGRDIDNEDHPLINTHIYCAFCLTHTNTDIDALTNTDTEAQT